MQTKKLWVFDLDGVLIHLEKKEVTENALFEKLIHILHKGDLIAINTGRAIPFIESEILTPLSDKLPDKELLQQVFVVGEKGGVWAEFEKDTWKESMDRTFRMPEKLIAYTKTLIETHFSKTMLFKEGKETMISTESKKGTSLSEFQEEQKKLVENLEVYMQKQGFAKKYTLDPSASATDIQDKRVGKHVGTTRILTWLKAGQKPTSVICFGDSQGDFRMAEEFYEKKFPVTFVYTGSQAVERKYPFTVITTNPAGEKGTLQFLENYS